METTKLREDVRRFEAPLQCRITCTECMERELLEPLTACDLVCRACMEETLASM